MIRSFVPQDFITVIIVLIIALITLLHFLYEERFIKLISIFNAREYFVDYLDDKIISISFFNVLLFLIQLGIYSILLFKIKLHYQLIDTNIISFLYILLVLFSFLAIRFLSGILLSFIFNLKEKQVFLSFVKFAYLSKASILILPFVIFSFYYPYYNVLLVKVNVAIVMIIVLYFYIKIIIMNQKIIFSNLFYFILYLCTLEIIPLVYLYKTII